MSERWIKRCVTGTLAVVAVAMLACTPQSPLSPSPTIAGATTAPTAVPIVTATVAGTTQPTKPTEVAVGGSKLPTPTPTTTANGRSDSGSSTAGKDANETRATLVARQFEYHRGANLLDRTTSPWALSLLPGSHTTRSVTMLENMVRRLVTPASSTRRLSIVGRSASTARSTLSGVILHR
jgi:hypothetical protein